MTNRATAKCKQPELGFASCQSRKVFVNFGGGDISSEGGLLLLREVDRKLDVIGRAEQLIGDPRQQGKVGHTTESMLKQHDMAIVQVYEDLNDDDLLRHDSLLQTVLSPRQRAHLVSHGALGGQTQRGHRAQHAADQSHAVRKLATSGDIYKGPHSADDRGMTRRFCPRHRKNNGGSEGTYARTTQKHTPSKLSEPSVPIISTNQQLSRLHEIYGLGSSKGYFWIYHSNTAGVLYDWKTGCDHRCLDNILAKGGGRFKGLLQCDGYSAYETWAGKHPGVVLAGCWAHARRKFHEALPCSPGAATILRIIQKLYDAEHQYREWITKHQHPPEAIVHYRRRYLKPLLRSLRNELLALHPKCLPQSKMGKALGYAINQWHKLCLAVKHSPTLDNNVAENAVRPLKLGAKNWLFVGSEDTGWRSAVIYTLIENIRREGKDPYAYLKWVFERIPHMSNQDNLEALLPKTWLEQQGYFWGKEAHPARLSA